MGVPTIDFVKKLQEEAEKLFNDGDYEKALPALKKWAEQANWLANLIIRCLEPYYSGSYDDKKSFSYAKLKQLAPFESLSNQFKAQRDLSMIMQAECLVRLNRNEEAVVLYYKVLDLIDINDWLLWTRAINGLYRIIGISQIVN